MITRNSDSILSDEDFIKQASHLLIQKELQSKEYIYFKNLAANVSPEILKTYMDAILDSVYMVDGRVSLHCFQERADAQNLYIGSPRIINGIKKDRSFTVLFSFL